MTERPQEPPESGGWHEVSFRFKTSEKLTPGLNALALAEALMREIERQQPHIRQAYLSDARVEPVGSFYFDASPAGTTRWEGEDPDAEH